MVAVAAVQPRQTQPAAGPTAPQRAAGVAVGFDALLDATVAAPDDNATGGAKPSNSDGGPTTSASPADAVSPLASTPTTGTSAAQATVLQKAYPITTPWAFTALPTADLQNPPATAGGVNGADPNASDAGAIAPQHFNEIPASDQTANTKVGDSATALPSTPPRSAFLTATPPLQAAAAVPALSAEATLSEPDTTTGDFGSRPSKPSNASTPHSAVRDATDSAVGRRSSAADEATTPATSTAALDVTTLGLQLLVPAASPTATFAVAATPTTPASGEAAIIGGSGVALRGTAAADPGLSDIASAASTQTSPGQPWQPLQGDPSENLTSSNPVADQPVLQATSRATAHATAAADATPFNVASATPTQNGSDRPWQPLQGSAPGNLTASNPVAAQPALQATSPAAPTATAPANVSPSNVAASASTQTSANPPRQPLQGDASAKLLASIPVAAQPVLHATTLASLPATAAPGADQPQDASVASTPDSADKPQQQLQGDASANVVASIPLVAQPVLRATPLATSRAIGPTRVTSGQALDAPISIGDMVQGARVAPGVSTDQAGEPIVGVTTTLIAQNDQHVSTPQTDGGAVAAFVSVAVSIAKPPRPDAATFLDAGVPTLTSDVTSAASGLAPDAHMEGQTEPQDLASSPKPAEPLADDKTPASIAATVGGAPATAPAPLSPTFPSAHLVAPTKSDAPVIAGAPEITSDTVANLVSQTASQANGGASQFQIELHPFGLGRVDVSVQIDGGGQLSAAFAFDRPQTAEALGARSGELQKALEQAGFSLADAGLSFSVAHAAAQTSAQASAQSVAQSGAQAQVGGSASQSSHFASGPGQTVQSFNTGAQGFGQSTRQDTPAHQGQASGRGRVVPAAAETVVTADPSRTPVYASRATVGVDIRI